MIKVIVADDHDVVRKGIISVLAKERDIEIVGESRDGSQALDACLEQRPDIVILDITMPEMNGIVASKAIREVCPSTRVIIMSMHVEDDIIYEALKSGASGYVLKEGVIDELVDAIRVVTDGGTYLSPDVASTVVRRLLEGGDKEKESSLSALSNREMQVLQLLSEGKTSREIANQLGISHKTVDNHKSNIMKKLDIYDVPTLVRYALKTGISKL